MKRNCTLILAAAAVLAIAGCSKTAGLEESAGITVDATVGRMTRVSNSGNGTSFTPGDRIAVYAWRGGATEVGTPLVVDGVRNTLGTDGKWTPESPMLWKNVRDEHYFLGIYPARTVTDFKADAFTLDPADYTASDLLIATNLGGVKAADGPVKLVFDHAMAKLCVNLAFRSQWDAAPTVTAVTATARKTATVDYLVKALTATGTADAVALSSASNAAWSGLLVPQEGVRKVTVTIGNKDYVYEAAADIPLNAGQYTTLSLLVGRDRVELGSVSVADWANQGEAMEGEAQEEIKDISRFFEDEVFRAFCLANYDANHDGFIVEEEVAGVTTMDVSGKGIKSLAGLAYFTNLTTLDCHDNDLDYLDVSKNINLKNLDCRNNYFESIYIKKGQTFENLQTFRKFASSPINIKVNGNDTVLIGEGETLVFTATLSDGITANSLTWYSDRGLITVTHQLQGNTDQLKLTYDAVKDILSPSELYEMYAETPDGIRSNSVGFGVCGDNPAVCFDNVYQSCYLNVNEEKYLHVKSYPGKQSTDCVLKYQLNGEGCNLSSIPAVTKEFTVLWNKPGDKEITVTVTDQDGKTGTSTFVVHVVEVTLIEL